MSSISGKEKLKKQLIDTHGKIVYTFTAHWKIVDRLKKQFTRIKIVQILLTAASAVGIFTSLIAKIPSLGWLGGIAAFLSLSINLYMLNFHLPDDIKNHTDAANELWDIRESYTSLVYPYYVLNLIDFLPCFFDCVYFAIFHTLYSFCKFLIKSIEGILFCITIICIIYYCCFCNCNFCIFWIF